MAEIKIKKKNPVWPWIILGLLVLGIIWYFFLRDSDNQVADEEENMTEQVIVSENENAYSNSAISQFSDYISDTDKMGIDHEYSNGALEYLIDAVKEKADMLNVDVDADLEEASNKASEVKEDPYEVDHADLIRSSGEIITRALTTLQQEEYPDLAEDLAQVDTALKAIKPSVKTLEQKDEVNNFFKSSESLLLKMQ